MRPVLVVNFAGPDAQHDPLAVNGPHGAERHEQIACHRPVQHEVGAVDGFDGADLLAVCADHVHRLVDLPRVAVLRPPGPGTNAGLAGAPACTDPRCAGNTGAVGRGVGLLATARVTG